MPQSAASPALGAGFAPGGVEPRVRAAHLLLIVGPALLLAGALGFQHMGGLAPCEMCMWQRWAHVGALALAGLAAAVRGGARAALLVLAAAAVLAGAGIAGMHAGVEQDWWEGPTQCAATAVTGTGGDFTAAMMGTPIVRCDAIAWELAGVSMAGWNLIFSALIGSAALWLLRRS